jgi:hypothetical protein
MFADAFSGLNKKEKNAFLLKKSAPSTYGWIRLSFSANTDWKQIKQILCDVEKVVIYVRSGKYNIDYKKIYNDKKKKYEYSSKKTSQNCSEQMNFFLKNVFSVKAEWLKLEKQHHNR